MNEELEFAKELTRIHTKLDNNEELTQEEIAWLFDMFETYANYVKRINAAVIKYTIPIPK